MFIFCFAIVSIFSMTILLFFQHFPPIAAPPSLYTRQFGTSATAEESTEDDGVGKVEEPVDCATARLESAQEAMQV